MVPYSLQSARLCIMVALHSLRYIVWILIPIGVLWDFINTLDILHNAFRQSDKSSQIDLKPVLAL